MLSIMLITIKVIPKSSRNEIKEEDGLLKVYLTAVPQKGRANKALIDLLARYFNVSKGAIELLKGERSRHKTVKVHI
ncbi:MAG: DUF167 domain-containing protein [Candidatus Omnitrophota bacterium]